MDLTTLAHLATEHREALAHRVAPCGSAASCATWTRSR